MNNDWIIPDWPAPAHVHAVTTTRSGGVSQPPYASLNLGDHVGDDPEVVARNRALLKQSLALPSEPSWLSQVHGCEVVMADSDSFPMEADASVSRTPGQVCAVLTADCLPLLLCDERGTQVAAIHAGWRGLCDGVIEATIKAMAMPGERLMAWLGPAIGADAFEVGDEVRQAFCEIDTDATQAFRPSGNKDRWMANIYQLARQRLMQCQLTKVYGGDFCTFHDAERFYSYRRDGQTGRMASLIWLDVE